MQDLHEIHDNHPQQTVQTDDSSFVTVPTHIVGIGASAGGLEALERLFQAMPATTGVAFVVVQHLSPDFKSLTDELLARRTSIPIQQATNDIPLRPDHIYLLPPRKDMILSGNHLLLTDKDLGQFMALPIDQFFRSLAQEAGKRAVGVILSGTGSDGSRGLRDIHAAGGLVIAQTPESAKFDGMPLSAIATEAVHLVLPPEEVGAALLRHINHPLGLGSVSRPEEQPAHGMAAIFRLLRDGYGIDFSHYKPDTVARRTERRLALHRSVSLDEYAEQLAQDPQELNRLYKDLLIGVTELFRDSDAFDRLREEVLPGLLNKVEPGDEFRVWCAGCATGEESYSLAILIQECLEEIDRNIPVKIFATDVHRASLDSAGLGIFHPESLAEISQDRLQRYFVRKDGRYVVTPDVRRLVVFAQHNVLKDAPFTKLDMIVCRNLLIYFQPSAQKKVLSLYHFGLKPGGVLFLGPSEGPGDLSDEFDPIDTRWKIYRKRRDVRLVPDLRISVPGAERPRSPVPLTTSPPHHDSQLLSVLDALLDESLHPSLLVNERREIVRTIAGASRYLRLADGWLSTDVLDLVDPELRTALSGALPRVFKEASPIAYKGLRVQLGEGVQLVNVTVKPIVARRSGPMYALIRLQEIGSALGGQLESAREMQLSQASQEQVISLEWELRSTKENLQAMIEELETSNEELQATNEELTAANEELQSTNEELHSVNEELYTVNGEYQKKIHELTELTSDMDNLLLSTEIHTLFLDDNLCIRKFTPMLAEVFNLLPQDVGRRIETFSNSLDHAGLLNDLRQVRETATIVERQVRDHRGRWFLLRILPYKTGVIIKGVVLALIDINRIIHAESALHQKDQHLNSILKNSPNWVFIKETDGKYLLVDEAFKRLVGCDPVGKTPFDLFPPETATALASQDQRVLESGQEDETEIEIPHPDGVHTYLSIMFPIRDDSGQITALGGIRTDVTALKHAENQAREAVGQRDSFLAMLSHELRNPLAAIVNAAEVLIRSGTNSTETTTMCIGIIERRARHMGRLLDDLLDVARITQNKIEIRKEPFDLTTTISDVLEEVGPWYTERNLHLHIEKPSEPILVNGDAARLQQIQVNLMRNAAKYTPAGGNVWYRLRIEDGEAVISVKDTGVGMNPEMLTKVFDLFVQADETLDRSSGGIGIGLTLVRSIVELHDGTVEARSDGHGKGSEFLVRLPLSSVAPTTDGDTKGAAQQGKTPHSHSKQVLIVEDDPDNRELLHSLLKLEGYEVKAVGDGLKALEQIEEDCPDIAVVDIGIPGLNGYELAGRLREKYPPQRLHLIALTGYGRPGDCTAAAEAGFDAHLTKPCNPNELMEALAKVSRNGS